MASTDLGCMSPETGFSSETFATNITVKRTVFGSLHLSIMVP